MCVVDRTHEWPRTIQPKSNAEYQQVDTQIELFNTEAMHLMSAYVCNGFC